MNRDDLKKIIDIELGKVRKRLKDKNLELELTDQAKEFIIEKGSSLEFGARPLRRAIENLLEDPLAERLLRGDFHGFGTIKARVIEENGEKRLEFEMAPASVEELAVGVEAHK